MAQAKSQAKWPGKIQARAKASESGFPKLKPGPQATLGHPLGSGLAWLLVAGFGWLPAHGPGREVTNFKTCTSSRRWRRKGPGSSNWKGTVSAVKRDQIRAG